MDKRISSLKDLDAEDGVVYGARNKVHMINPFKSYLEVSYDDGSVFRGKDLFTTGWDKVKDGIRKLSYKLSTGHIIVLPKFKAYFPTIEVSESLEGFRLFHAIHIKCLADDKVLKYSIILKEDKISKYKIGDVIVKEETGIPDSPYWRMTA